MGFIFERRVPGRSDSFIQQLKTDRGRDTSPISRVFGRAGQDRTFVAADSIEFTGVAHAAANLESRIFIVKSACFQPMNNSKERTPMLLDLMQSQTNSFRIS